MGDRRDLEDAASPEDRSRIARLLIHRVEMFPEQVKIYYKVAEGSVAVRPNEQTSNAANAAGGDEDTKKADSLCGGPALFWLDGSKRLTNGGNASTNNTSATHQFYACYSPV